VPRRRLEVFLPTRGETWQLQGENPLLSSNEEVLACFVKVREALALLAAVAHVDQEGWRYLLKTHCGVLLGKAAKKSLMKKSSRKKYPPGLCSSWSSTSTSCAAQHGINRALQKVCQDFQRRCRAVLWSAPARKSKSSYLSALEKIAALNKDRKPGASGVDSRSRSK
jgi:hypothetical protein